ncbi:substrate-binding periplasmic protein [Dongshaea marina]|uniref:substrate-binding periplasmic protein n=1 Tax=Dongshaea marina TaxID=2047966 RepID=UPI000D3E447D|nr:transporter substrate-binding domain-containing protein [Dongshaea marina]
MGCVVSWVGRLLFGTLLGSSFLALSQAPQSVRISAGEFPPYLTAKQHNNGIAGQIIREAFESQGVKVTFYFMLWQRAFLQAQHGQADASAIWLKKPEREKLFYYSQPIVEEQHVFFYRKDRPFDWQSIEDLEDYHMGGLFGFSYGPDMDKALADGKLKMERVVRDKMNFKKLLRKKIDLYPQERLVGYQVVRRSFKQQDTEQITHHPKPFLTKPSYLIFPKSSAESQKLLSIFNQGMKELHQSGRIKQISEGLNSSVTP